MLQNIAEANIPLDNDGRHVVAMPSTLWHIYLCICVHSMVPLPPLGGFPPGSLVSSDLSKTCIHIHMD